MVGLTKVVPAKIRYLRDVFKEIIDENTLAVTNLAAGATKSKLLYIEELGEFITKQPSSGGVFFADAKTTNANLRMGLDVGLWWTLRTIGAIIDTSPSYLADFIYELFATSSVLTYTEIYDYCDPFGWLGNWVTVGDKAYFCIWLAVQNLSASPLSGTVYVKNIKSTVNSGYFKE